ncbi:MAG: protein kinase, partial [Deltaproteobacteria bacterium]
PSSGNAAGGRDIVAAAMADASAGLERSAARLSPGTLLADHYRIESIVGQGGFGVVWRARHVHLETECAVKLFDPPPGADPQDASARFLQEARVLAHLKCPYVVQVYDYGVHGQMPFLVLELLTGSSLASHLQALREQGRRLSAQHTAGIIAQVAEALHVAHQARVVHRDLKPENIFLVQEGDRQTAKVLDFGIAKWSADAAPRMTTTRTVMGTPYYMSPEQFESARNVDHRADLWSLGVVAFECLTGQVPFPGDSFIDVAFKVCKEGPLVASQLARVPAGFDGWFARSTALGREYRFASAREQARALEEVCSAVTAELPAAPSAPALVAPAGTGTLLRRSSAAVELTPQLLRRTLAGKRRWVLAAAAVVLGALLALFVLPKKGALTVTVAGGPGNKELSVVEVVLDNELCCETSPCEITGLHPGTHYVEVRAPGYQATAKSAVAILSGQMTAHNVQLIRAGTGIKVFGEGSWLTLLVDGRELGPLPRELHEMEPGEHVIQVTGGPRYEVFQQRIVVDPGRMTPIGPIRLRVTKGLATIRAGPGAEDAEVTLKVGDSRRVLPPLPVRLEVETDRPHVLRARRQGFASFEEPIVFEAGEAEKTIEITLAKRGDDTALRRTTATGTPGSQGTAPAEPESQAAAPPTSAKLNITSTPPSNVLLDGKPLGTTPLRDLSVVPGSHRVIFIYGAERKSKTVLVEAGSSLTVFEEF